MNLQKKSPGNNWRPLGGCQGFTANETDIGIDTAACYVRPASPVTHAIARHFRVYFLPPINRQMYKLKSEKTATSGSRRKSVG